MTIYKQCDMMLQFQEWRWEIREKLDNNTNIHIFIDNLSIKIILILPLIVTNYSNSPNYIIPNP